MRFIKSTDVLLLLLITVVIFAVFSKALSVYAVSSGYLTATVKISICGNGIVEGIEDCEGDDLNGKTCELLDYLGGSLTCDIACSFDTTGCTPTPSPTPTSTSTPTPAPTSTTSSSSTSLTSGGGSSSSSSIAQTITTIVNNILEKIGLSAPLLIYDMDDDGSISIDEMTIAVQNWADSFFGVLWSQFDVNAASSPEVVGEIKKCDINRDGNCNIVDFSILLYFVER